MLKKMKYFLVLISFDFIFSFENSDICAQKDIDCKGIYDEHDVYKIDCKKETCQSIHKYRCDIDRCAIDQKSCHKYLDLKNDLIKVLISPLMHLSNLKKYNFLVNGIQDCPSTKLKWNPRSICLKANNCFTQQDFVFYRNVFHFKKKTD